jgi:hypothetical protein
VASHAIQPDDSQALLLPTEEGWNLILRSFGSAKDLYAEYGGGEAWLRAERESWSPAEHESGEQVP